MPDFHSNVTDLIREVKTRLPEYLFTIGITNLKKPFRCLSPSHEDIHPSMQYNPKNNTVHCFACGAHYDILNLIAMDENLDPSKDFIKILKTACSKFNIPFRSFDGANGNDNASYLKSYFEKCSRSMGRFNYFTSRGLSPDTIKKFNLGIDRHFAAGHEIFIKAAIIPTGPESFVARNTDSSAGPKMRYRKHGPTKMFNLEGAFSQNRPVIIAEGEIDALSVIEAGFNAIGLGSTSNASAFIKYCREYHPAQPMIIAMDNDEKGQAAAQKIYKSLRELSLNCEIKNLYGRFKDANEALLKDKAKFIEALTASTAEMEQNMSCADDEDFILSLYRRLSAKDKEAIKKAMSALVA